MSLKDDLSAIKPARTEVACGNHKVYVRRLSKLEKLKDITATQKAEESKDHEGLFRHLAGMLVKCVQDESGAPVWTDTDIDAVMGLADDVFDSLLNALYQVAPKN